LIKNNLDGINEDTIFAKTYKMLDQLFTFPIVMIDGENEERKAREKEQINSLLNKDEEDDEEDFDMIFGEAEYPYWDFIGVEDRWLPSIESLDKAMKGKFEACTVRFLHVGQILVPWSKKKFKAELLKFAQAYDLAHPKVEKKPVVQEIRIESITPDQYKTKMEDGNEK
jgi:hypothetical protein